MSSAADHDRGFEPLDPHRGRGFEPDRRLIASLVLNLLITLLQVVGGIISNSLGLLSDAAHNLSDVVALGMSLWAVRLGRRPATPRRTFAYKRAEILVAMFNSAVLVAISVYIIVEAIRRLLDPQPVEGLWVVGFAAGGLLINALAAFLLRSHHHDLNLLITPASESCSAGLTSISGIGATRMRSSPSSSPCGSAGRRSP